MNIDPLLNKSEYIVCLMIMNMFMADFNKDKLEIIIRPALITKNPLTTQTINSHLKLIIENLVGRKIICDRDKKPSVVLFEKIDKTKNGYEIKISPTVRQLLMTEKTFTFLYFDVIQKLKTYKSIKFYCLMKIWGNRGEFYCYLKWLKWYLNIQDLNNKRLFKLYLNKFVIELNEQNVLIKMVKHKDPNDKRLVQKLSFDVFDNSGDNENGNPVETDK
jgi:hypothetical protein